MKTVEEIYREMMDTFSRETGMEPDGTGEVAVRMYALAAQVYGLYQELSWTRRQCFPQTATGEDLEKHALLRGLTRRSAAPAIGYLRFSVPKALDRDVPIPLGTVCMTPGLVAFETTNPAVLAAGQLRVDVTAQAAEPGPGGNVSAGTVRVMSVAPVGIAACTNPIAFAGGRDEEDDETLRARVLESYQSLSNGVNAAYYAQQALRVPGVEAVKVLPRRRGLGTVDIVIASAAGIPDQALRDRVLAALEPKREIAVDLQVLAPTPRTVNIQVKVKAAEGTLAKGVRDQVRGAIQDCFDGELLGEDLLLARLGQVIYAVKGVENYRIVSPAADLPMEGDQLPVLGELSVEEL